jgi:hypothetical protein
VSMESLVVPVFQTVWTFQHGLRPGRSLTGQLPAVSCP